MEDKLKEEKEIAKDWWRICLEEATYAKGRSNSLSDEYSKNLLQISAIIFGVATAFIGRIIVQPFVVKLFFISGLVTLISSLVFGMVNTQLREGFWENIVTVAHRRAKHYDDARRGNLSLKEAILGATEAIQGKNKTGSPKWAWVTQTVLTFLGIIFIGVSVGVAVLK